VDRYFDLVRHVAAEKVGGEGCPASPPPFRVAIGEEQRRRVEALLAESGVVAAKGSGAEKEAEPGGEKRPGSGGRFIAVSPVAFWETKLWEEGKFAELCDRMATELGVAIVLTGGEAGPLDRIRVRMKSPAVNLGGRTSLRELACLYGRASLLVTTDSGPMHLAAAVGTPVVALFGPTDPARTGPYGPGHRVIRRELTCSPCLKKQCETRRCMREIGVEEVFEAVREMLARG
jgi:3-deoxy-D-manno-octulosonic-acid transferase/heptosyltransferase-1